MKLLSLDAWHATCSIVGIMNYYRSRPPQGPTKFFPAALMGKSIAVIALGVLPASVLGCEDTTPEALDPLRKVGDVANLDVDPGAVPDTFRRTVFKLDTNTGSNVDVKVDLQEVKKGVRIRVKLDHAAPGQYPVVFYDAGDCGNPPLEHAQPFRFSENKPEGGAPHLGSVRVEKDKDGTGLWLTSRGNLRDGDPETLLGKPVVVYASAPDGSPGDQLACGIVELD